MSPFPAERSCPALSRTVKAKAIAAVTPAIVATWISYIIYLIGVRFMVNDTIFARVTAPEWLLAILVVSPLLTLLSVSIAIMISSRVSDPRVAEQMSALVDQQLIVIIGVIVALIDAALIYLSFRLFQRETILTRWK